MKEHTRDHQLELRRCLLRGAACGAGAGLGDVLGALVWDYDVPASFAPIVLVAYASAGAILGSGVWATLRATSPAATKPDRFEQSESSLALVLAAGIGLLLLLVLIAHRPLEDFGRYDQLAGLVLLVASVPLTTQLGLRSKIARTLAPHPVFSGVWLGIGFALASGFDEWLHASLTFSGWWLLLPAVSRIRSARRPLKRQGAGLFASLTLAVLLLEIFRQSGAPAVLLQPPNLLQPPKLLQPPIGREVLPKERTSPSATRPNLILIVLDTVRRDHLSLYGYERETTPNIDTLAARAFVYSNAITTSSYTLPSHASLLTGLYPSEHRATRRAASIDEQLGFHPGDPIALGVDTLADLLSAVGYQTAGIVANTGYLSREFGFHRGFNSYDDRPRIAPGTVRAPSLWTAIRVVVRGIGSIESMKSGTSRNADEITDLALETLAGLPEPFFLFLNYMDAHAPYSPPQPFDDLWPGRSEDLLEQSNSDELRELELSLERGELLAAETRAHLISQYDGAISFLDAQLARLFAAVRSRGIDNRSWIVVTSDHGEHFGEHRHLTHGVGLYAEALNIPLIIRPPDGRRQIRRNEHISLRDVPHILLSKFGVDPSPAMKLSVQSAEALPGPVAELFLPLAFIRWRGDRHPTYRRSLVLEDGSKLLDAKGHSSEFYSAADRAEAIDLSSQRREEIAVAHSSLADWERRLAEVAIHPTESGTMREPLRPEVVDALKELGYLE